MSIELTKKLVDSSYLGSVWLKKNRRKNKHPKKEPFFHYFYTKFKFKFWDISQ